MFVNRTKEDFWILGDSGTGDIVWSVEPLSEDIIGVPWSLGDGYAIGAYEFGPDNSLMLSEEYGGPIRFVATAGYRSCFVIF